MNYTFSGDLGEVTFDFENQQVRYNRNTKTATNMFKLFSCTLSFDEITDIEFRPKSLLGVARFSLILNNKRAVNSINGDITNFTLKNKDAESCQAVLKKLAELRGISELKKTDRKEVPTIRYSPAPKKVVEYRKKCNVCGKVYCFNSDDIKRNQDLAKQAQRNAIAGGLNALAGTRYDMYEQTKQAQSALDKITDYSRCPYCNSTDISNLTEEEFKSAMAENNTAAPTTIVQQASAADELKKFKDLLDSGIITQEEFNAKKKQLLGL